MVKKPTVGLVIADSDNYSLARNAIENSLRQIDVKEVLVFSDNSLLASGYRHIPIKKIASINEYNQLILAELPRYLNCDYYLLIQYDGFALNRHKFSPDFLSCDYIGALWPQHPFHRVGNGGFSMRSRRIIEATAQLSVLHSNEEPEDAFICRTIRPLLETRFKISFAPEDVAKRFSFEAIGQSTDTFGFHGFYNLPLVYANNLDYLFAQMPNTTIRRRREELIRGSALLPSQLRAHFDFLLSEAIETIGRPS